MNTLNFQNLIQLITNREFIIETKDIEKPGVIIFTSGSEGKPKGVVLSHRALLSNVAQIKSVFSFGIEDKIFNALPMFHSFGLTAGKFHE